MTVAIGQAGNGIGAMVVIYHSPAFTSGKPASNYIRGYLSGKAQYASRKKIFFLPSLYEGARIIDRAPMRKPKYPPLAEPACRSYPNWGPAPQAAGINERGASG